ncbi:MAG: hypothetical protein WCK61_02190 [Candidatus Omnitrophota bacterium]
MKKRKFKLPVKIISILAIILLVLSLLIGYIWKALTTSDFFTVKQVVVRNSNVSFDYLKGKNIFSLDLQAYSRQALLSCPDCRKIRFARVLPNRVLIDFVKRKPLALVKFYKNFAIDEEGLFFYPNNTVEFVGLPIIYGLETKIFGPKPGVKYKRVEIKIALDIINEFKNNRSFRGFTLKRIDVANAESAGFFILAPAQIVNYTKSNPQVEWVGFEVRVGENNIREKMMVLGGLVTQAAKEWANIKYIDLRFKEPVIKLNNTGKDR